MADELELPTPALTWSAECGEIFTALAKAQAAMGKLTKAKTVDVPNKSGGTLYSYDYADLPATLDACLAAFNAEGCSVIQVPRVFDNGVEVTTVITHGSGQWIMAAPLFMPVKATGAQDVGSGITYARRYALWAIGGLSPADDDGKAAQDAKPETWDRPREAARSKPRTPSSPDLGARCSGPKGAPISQAAERRMRLLANEDEDATLQDVWYWALKTAEINVSRYGGSGPVTAQALTIPDGVKLNKLLSEKCVSLGIDDADPTSKGAP